MSGEPAICTSKVRSSGGSMRDLSQHAESAYATREYSVWVAERSSDKL